MQKIYVISERNFLWHTARNLWINSAFDDNGHLMRIVSIGRARFDGTERVLELTAEPMDEGAGCEAGWMVEQVHA